MIGAFEAAGLFVAFVLAVCCALLVVVGVPFLTFVTLRELWRTVRP